MAKLLYPLVRAKYRDPAEPSETGQAAGNNLAGCLHNLGLGDRSTNFGSTGRRRKRPNESSFSALDSLRSQGSFRLPDPLAKHLQFAQLRK